MKTPITTPSGFGRVFWGTAVLLLALLKPAFSQAQAGQVVISEVYPGGGTTAAFRNDFVELYNKSTTAYGLDGYSVQYHSANSSGAFDVVALTGLTIPANGYLLVQFGGAATGNALPAPDAASTQALSTVGGKIAFVNGLTPLAGSAAANAAGIVDFVGYGTSNRSEGSAPAPAPATNQSIERKARATSTSASMAPGGLDATQGNGADSDNNSQDFVTRATPEPQNSAAAIEALAAVFYNTKNATGPLNDLATYSSTPDGTGPSPTSFAADFQLFVISGADRTLTGDLTVTGTDSRLLLQSGASFVVPAAFDYTGRLDLNANATLVELNADPGVVFNSIDAGSTVEYAQATAYTVPAPGIGYGNLTLRNATKQLSSGTTVVRGNFLADNVGASGSASTLSLAGNFTLTGVVQFSTAATDRIALALTNTSTAQVVNGGGNLIKLFSLTTGPGQAGASLADGVSSLELGDATGGGYNLANGTTLAVGNNTLGFVAGGSAAIGAGTGQLTLSPSSTLAFRKAGTTALGTLRVNPATPQLANLTVDASGPDVATANANALTLSTSLTVNNTLALTAGTLAIGAGNVLTLNGPVVVGASGFLRGATTASLVVGGSGALGTFRLGTGTGANSTLSNFTLNRPGATFSLGTNLIVANAFALAQGTFEIGFFGLTLNGTVATTATGLFSGTSSSQIRIAGTGPLGTLAFAPSVGVLGVLALNRPGGRLTIVTSPVQVSALTLTNGVLALGEDVSLTVGGTLVVSDPSVAQFASTSTSSLNFTGTGAIGPLAFVAGENELQSLSLARSSGAPTAQLLTDLTVGNLTLTNGRIFAPAASTKLTLKAGGSLSAGGINGYTNTLTQFSVTNSGTPEVSLAFPLGVNGQARLLAFVVRDQIIGTTAYTARQFEAPSPTRTLPPTLARVSRIRYYNVVRESANGPETGTLASARIRLSYTAASDGVTTANQGLLRVAMTDPADNTRWKDIGGFGDGAGVTSVDFPDGPLGDFTLATDINTPPNTNPLPVELVRFAAQRAAAGVQVTWATATEKNSARFEVERSLNGFVFATVLNVAAQGNSSQLHAYSAVDAQAPAGRLYYRLRQVDVDGTVAFSSVVTVEGPDGPADELSVWPNPTADRLQAALPAAAGRTYRVLNSLGQVVDKGAAAGADPELDVRRLPAGTYFLELSSAAGRQVRRFVKYD